MTSPPHPLQDGSLDPLALLRRSRGDNDPRDTKLRLLWLRQREPEARVRTKLISLDEHGVVMSARIALPGGGSASAHAAGTITDGTIERTIAETELRAIAGALDALGYIVIDTDQAAHTDPPSPTDPAPAETPRRQPPGHVQAIRALRDRERSTPEAGPEDPRIEEEAEVRPQPVEPTPSRSPQRGPAPVDRHPSQMESAPVDLSERRRSAPVPGPAQPPAPAVDDDVDPELEDISWTAFWQWARDTYQIGSRGQVEKLLGVPVDRESPGQLRQMLITHFDGGSSDKS